MKEIIDHTIRLDLRSRIFRVITGVGFLLVTFSGQTFGQKPPKPDPRECLRPINLKCENDREPMGVDVLRPRLSWNLEGEGYNRRQSAYHILVSTSAELLKQDKADLWDSERVASDRMIGIEYAGKPLPSSTRIFWKVRVWDEKGRPGPWSPIASWVTGLFSDSEWKAKWIGISNATAATVLLRNEFVVRPGAKLAILHVCGLGQFELIINGQRVGEAILMPGWTKYDQTCLYETFEVTDLLTPGTNVIGLLLGGGFYRITGGRYAKFKGSFGPLQAIVQLHIRYADGHEDVICSTENWKGCPGPITFSCVYGGEDYDARLYPRGWDKPGYDDSAWEQAVTYLGPGGKLRGHSASAPPIKVVEIFKPVAIKHIQTNVAVYDFGQNASIMVRLVCEGPPGSKIRMIPAELVSTNGFVDRTSCGRGRAWWEYTLGGEGRETYTAKFFYHGARYVQVERYSAPETSELPVVVSLDALVVHSAAEPVGDFACSNELFNRIRRLVRWAQRSNMMSVFTDCPHREKLGWLEQYHLNGPALRYEFEVDRIFVKGMNDMKDSQLTNGMIPCIAPEYVVFGKDKTDFSNPFRNSVEWGSAFIIVPWQQYLFSGDMHLIRDYFSAMERYMDFLSSQASNYILHFGLGDWYDLGPNPPGYAQLTPRSLTATAFYYYNAQLMAQYAKMLGQKAKAKAYSQLGEKIKKAFNKEFFDPTNRWYGTGSQTAQAISLVFGLCPPAQRTCVFQSLTNDIVRRDFANTAGDIGYRFMLRALADNGASHLVYLMNNQTNKPGYGYQLAMGATSLTEAWDARPTSSQNHFMLGQIIEWFYHDLAGIQPDPIEPGFKRVIIRPNFLADLDWVYGRYKSVRGEIVSAWRRFGNTISMRVKIPPNTSAVVWVPSHSIDNVTICGVHPKETLGAKLVGKNRGYLIFKIGSGEYHFTTRIGNLSQLGFMPQPGGDLKVNSLNKLHRAF